MQVRVGLLVRVLEYYYGSFSSDLVRMKGFGGGLHGDMDRREVHPMGCSQGVPPAQARGGARVLSEQHPAHAWLDTTKGLPHHHELRETRSIRDRVRVRAGS